VVTRKALDDAPSFTEIEERVERSWLYRCTA